MYIEQLVIEITRRCNATCDHCLRGDAQNKDISDKTIEKLFESISGIGMITFTGGEPSLAVDRMRKILRECRRTGIPINSFYVVTNGKKPSVPLVHFLIDLHAYILEMNEYPDEDMSCLCISKDQYHEWDIGDIEEANQLYRSLSFYNSEARKHQISDQALIDEGRANEKGLGGRILYIEPLSVELDADGNPERVDSTVYINAKGDVVPSCDMSYASQDESKIGNIHKQTLAEILLAEVSKGVQ